MKEDEHFANCNSTGAGSGAGGLAAGGAARPHRRRGHVRRHGEHRERPPHALLHLDGLPGLDRRPRRAAPPQEAPQRGPARVRRRHRRQEPPRVARWKHRRPRGTCGSSEVGIAKAATTAGTLFK